MAGSQGGEGIVIISQRNMLSRKRVIKMLLFIGELPNEEKRVRVLSGYSGAQRLVERPPGYWAGAQRKKQEC